MPSRLGLSYRGPILVSWINGKPYEVRHAEVFFSSIRLLPDMLIGHPAADIWLPAVVVKIIGYYMRR